MEERATGIILRKLRLSETSLIIHWLAADQGRVATVAKGAHRPKSPLRGKLDLFFECEFTFTRSRKGDLHTLKEALLISPAEHLRRDLHTMYQVSYAAALIELTTETQTPLQGAYELLKSFITALQQLQPKPRYVFAIELKLLHILGLTPDSTQQDGTRLGQLIDDLTVKGWGEIASMEVSGSLARQLRQFLHGFLIYHLGSLPKGRAEALRFSLER